MRYNHTMKSLLLLVLCCLTELALSDTDIYNVAYECNRYFSRDSEEALVYMGSFKNMKSCVLRFKLTDDQRDFTFRIDNLVTNNTGGVSMQIQKYKSSQTTTLWKNLRFYDESDFSVKVNVTCDYELKIVIEMLDQENGYPVTKNSIVSMNLVVTPSYPSEYCRGTHSKPPYYLCSTTHECVHGDLRCDGHNNCGESEDEMSCTTKPIGSATTKKHVSTTAWPKPGSSFGYWSTETPKLNESNYVTSNSTVVYVFWWHSWYITSMVVISGILMVLLFLGVTVCCVQSCCKKNRVRTVPSSTSVNSRSARVPESIQVSVIQSQSQNQNQNQSKPYSELPPAYSAVVASPPPYAHVNVFLDSPCGNSNPI